MPPPEYLHGPPSQPERLRPNFIKNLGLLFEKSSIKFVKKMRPLGAMAVLTFMFLSPEIAIAPVYASEADAGAEIGGKLDAPPPIADYYAAIPQAIEKIKIKYPGSEITKAEVVKLVKAESGEKSEAVSPKGARGPTQLMPATFLEMLTVMAKEPDFKDSIGLIPQHPDAAWFNLMYSNPNLVVYATIGYQEKLSDLIKKYSAGRDYSQDQLTTLAKIAYMTGQEPVKRFINKYPSAKTFGHNLEETFSKEVLRSLKERQ